MGGSAMSNQRFSPEFKDEAVRQIVDRGYSVAEVSERFGAQPVEVGESGEARQDR
jgi:transposase